MWRKTRHPRDDRRENVGVGVGVGVVECGRQTTFDLIYSELGCDRMLNLTCDFYEQLHANVFE